VSSIFFSIEQHFYFNFEANVDYLANPTTQNLDLFFKNQNTAFTFYPKSTTLEIGDGIIEDFMHEAESNPLVDIDKKIVILNHYLTVLDFKSEVDLDEKIDAYCRYADYLLKRKLPKDIEEADQIISKCLDNVSRKDHFEYVAVCDRSVFRWSGRWSCSSIRG